ncbi:hypothetical protein [uncultured Hoeflea sp.]|uniref:hypothetical protein n=1 Tax=uncultured Hoeflea sp. TaxID=538666 RepID=UPI002610F126|nr:hypothetical protein [uncultured Hoeflea sp.]
MLPEDDYLRLKPADGHHKTTLRIALMALLGCLLLMSALVLQAGATPHYGGKPTAPAGFDHRHQVIVPGLDTVRTGSPTRPVEARAVSFP